MEKTSDNPKKQHAIMAMESLTKQDRKEVLRLYCLGCGTRKEDCECSPDPFNRMRESCEANLGTDGCAIAGGKCNKKNCPKMK